MSEISAYHEAGHAFMAIYVGARVRYVTIEPDRELSSRPLASGILDAFLLRIGNVMPMQWIRLLLCCPPYELYVITAY